MTRGSGTRGKQELPGTLHGRRRGVRVDSLSFTRGDEHCVGPEVGVRHRDVGDEERRRTPTCHHLSVTDPEPLRRVSECLGGQAHRCHENGDRGRPKGPDDTLVKTLRWWNRGYGPAGGRAVDDLSFLSGKGTSTVRYRTRGRTRETVILDSHRDLSDRQAVPKEIPGTPPVPSQRSILCLTGKFDPKVYLFIKKNNIHTGYVENLYEYESFITNRWTLSLTYSAGHKNKRFGPLRYGS